MSQTPVPRMLVAPPDNFNAPLPVFEALDVLASLVALQEDVPGFSETVEDIGPAQLYPDTFLFTKPCGGSSSESGHSARSGQESISNLGVFEESVAVTGEEAGKVPGVDAVTVETLGMVPPSMDGGDGRGAAEES